MKIEIKLARAVKYVNENEGFAGYTRGNAISMYMVKKYDINCMAGDSDNAAFEKAKELSR